MGKPSPLPNFLNANSSPATASKSSKSLLAAKLGYLAPGFDATWRNSSLTVGSQEFEFGIEFELKILEADFQRTASMHLEAEDAAA
jgi:hypothetical protein